MIDLLNSQQTYDLYRVVDKRYLELWIEIDYKMKKAIVNGKDMVDLGIKPYHPICRKLIKLGHRIHSFEPNKTATLIIAGALEFRPPSVACFRTY